jgi:hypothetical protein
MFDAFFTEALPCESCGQPVQSRKWNPEYELWIGTDCSCQAPDQPIPECMIAVLEAAQTVIQLCESVHAHKLTCSVCGPVQLPRKPAAGETDSERLKREAA